MQLRKLSRAAGAQQKQSGRSMSKAELLEALSQHISKQQQAWPKQEQHVADTFS